MTFPSGTPEGYPDQGPPQESPQQELPQQEPPRLGPVRGHDGTQRFSSMRPQQQQPRRLKPSAPWPNPLAGMELDGWLCLGTLVLALIAYFIGFSDAGAALNTEIDLLLAAGVLAALRVVPKSAELFLPAAVVLSTVGALGLLAEIVHIPSNQDTPAAGVLILVAGILQMLVTVAAYLMDKKIISLPQPRWSYDRSEGPGVSAGQPPSAQRTQYVPPPPQAPHQPPAPPGAYAQRPPASPQAPTAGPTAGSPQQPPPDAHRQASPGSQPLAGGENLTSYLPASGDLDEGQPR